MHHDTRHDDLAEYQDPLEAVPDYERFEQEQLAQDLALEVGDDQDLAAEFADLPWAESPPTREPHEQLMREAAKAVLAASQRIGWPLPRDEAALRDGALAIAAEVLRAGLAAEVTALDSEGLMIDDSLLPYQSTRQQLRDIESALQRSAAQPRSSRGCTVLLVAEAQLRGIRVILEKALGEEPA